MWREKRKVRIFGKGSVSSSPIVRIFGKGKCKFIANFSATMVTSLPSISLSLSLSLSVSLSLSPKVPHAQYRKRGSTSYIPRFLYCAWGTFGEREREIQRKRERRKGRHHCRAKLAMSFALLLAKNVHHSFDEEFCAFPCQKIAP